MPLDFGALAWNWLDKLITGLGHAVCGLIAGIATVISAIEYFTNWFAKEIIEKCSDMSNGVWVDIWKNVENVYDKIMLVAAGIFLVYWLMSVIEKSTKDQLHGNELMRTGIELIVGFVLMIYGFNMLKGICQTVIPWGINVVREGMNETTETEDENGNKKKTFSINQVQALALCGINSSTVNEGVATGNQGKEGYSFMDEFGPVDSIGITVDCAQKGDKHANPFQFLGQSVKFIGNAILGVVIELIIALVSIILSIILGALCLSRSIQLVIYTMFAPLAFADTFHQGFINSKCWRFCMKFIGTGLQAGIVYAAAMLGPYVGTAIGQGFNLNGSTSNAARALAQTSMASGLNAIITAIFIIIGQLTGLAIATKASQISSDLMGA